MSASRSQWVTETAGRAQFSGYDRSWLQAQVRPPETTCCHSGSLTVMAPSAGGGRHGADGSVAGPGQVLKGAPWQQSLSTEAPSKGGGEATLPKLRGAKCGLCQAEVCAVSSIHL